MTIKIDHINLTVTNLNESIQWYGRIFGFELVESGTNPLGTKWGIVGANDSMLCMSEFAGRAAADTNEDRSTHRIYHFGIRVSDAEVWRGIVKANQLKLHYGGEVTYQSSTSWYVHDPSGHEIEVSCSAGQPLQFPQRGA